MGPKTKSMKFTDLKDMLKKSGEAYGERPANNRGGYGISGSSKNIGFRVTIF